MSGWAKSDLEALEWEGEIRVAGRRQDGSPRALVIVWHVVVDGAVYVRSVRGEDGRWYRGVTRVGEGVIAWDGQTREVTYIPDSSADDAIDAAYVVKYGNSSATRSITSPAATATTLRIEPR